MAEDLMTKLRGLLFGAESGMAVTTPDNKDHRVAALQQMMQMQGQVPPRPGIDLPNAQMPGPRGRTRAMRLGEEENMMHDLYDASERGQNDLYERTGGRSGNQVPTSIDRNRPFEGLVSNEFDASDSSRPGETVGRANRRVGNNTMDSYSSQLTQQLLDQGSRGAGTAGRERLDLKPDEKVLSYIGDKIGNDPSGDTTEFTGDYETDVKLLTDNPTDANHAAFEELHGKDPNEEDGADDMTGRRQ